VTASAQNRGQADVADSGQQPRRLTLVPVDAGTAALHELIRLLNEVVAEGVLPAL